jgi:hypothetical protein
LSSADPETDPRGSHRGRPKQCRLLAIIASSALIATFASGCGEQSASTGAPSPSQATFAGTVLSPAKAAPRLALHNYLGDPINLTQDHGKTVLVTVLYTHCVDVCPLIANKLGVALGQLVNAGHGRAHRAGDGCAWNGELRADPGSSAPAQLQNPAITDTVNNGINAFIFVLKRANCILPPRSGRSFPLLSRQGGATA